MFPGPPPAKGLTTIKKTSRSGVSGDSSKKVRQHSRIRRIPAFFLTAQELEGEPVGLYHRSLMGLYDSDDGSWPPLLASKLEVFHNCFTMLGELHLRMYS